MATPSPDSRRLRDWLAWLETLSPREIELGLDRVAAVLERLHIPRPARVVHVAGTNGKGSTVAMLEGLYAAAGRRVACYTSPHVLRYNERMRVAGRELSDADIIAAFEAVEAARRGMPLTYFEYGTLAALVAFAAAGADVWVLEIGLGGRLDAVNAIDPDGVVITNVSLDHCDWLGPDIESIAREKAGVLRAGIPAVFAGDGLPLAIADEALRLGTELRVAGRDYRYAAVGGGWRFEGRGIALGELQPPSLAGEFQFANAAGALALFAALEGAAGIDAGFVARSFGRLRMTGRLQRIDGERRWLLDVAHNPGAAAVLAAELARERPAGRLLAVTGILADKDVDGILRPLLPLVDRWFAVTAESPRALPAVRLGAAVAAASGRSCRVVPDIAEALDVATRLSGPDDLLLVTGSFFTVGPALRALDPVTPDPLIYTRGAR